MVGGRIYPMKVMIETEIEICIHIQSNNNNQLSVNSVALKQQIHSSACTHQLNCWMEEVV